MNNAILNLRLRVYSLNCVGKPCQIVCAGDENTLYSPVPQTVQDGSPEFSTFIFTNLYSKDFFMTSAADSKNNVGEYSAVLYSV